MRPRLLDLFCGAGGCSVGYARAGFDVQGVDIEPHPDYPFPLTVMDVVELDADEFDRFDVVHASPPCPRYSSITPNRDDHPDLVAPTRERFKAWAQTWAGLTGGVWVIENVPGAPLIDPVTVCGAAMGLGTTCRDGVYRQLRRHRIFESNAPLMSPGCACDNRQKVGVYGKGGGGYYPNDTRGGGYKAWPDEAAHAMGIDWMTEYDDLADAIPPVYTEYIGAQLLDHLKAVA